ncbi:sulfite exporter TauE/SafE family protein [Gramella sp. GC03-9]|uniref:Probable membrane transporter protein n=1 Tax=Christiangramia oceanisediminis TaxID=2920386 RepID=A0A9X2R941_9FLAO|nr:sulfite exporter TauE/SafE family protein [Gramella oceanisediminis]MCP9200633.1 sulfite exporter TauE/SafE family protein [Gramella oceanisediminis]
MAEIFQDINILYLFILFAAGIIAFIISTISGGGGALILVPFLNFLISTTKTAPVLNLGTFIGRPARLIIFWKHINWKVFWYYVPAAMLGAWIAGWFFVKVNAGWLQILVGLFLVSTVFQYRFGKKERSFPVRLWYFIPLGFIVSLLGTIIGALGPILNPFYLNLGLDKEELIATKTVNSFFLGISQIGSYAFFGLLYAELWIYGIALGLGAVVGNIIGKKFLSKMKSSTFRKLLIILMVISGILLIYNQLK